MKTAGHINSILRRSTLDLTDETLKSDRDYGMNRDKVWARVLAGKAGK